MKILFFSLLFFICVLACSPTDNEPLFAKIGKYEWKIPFPLSDTRVKIDSSLTYQGIELGRMLFYENKLSADNSISCGTCHQQSLAFTDGKALAAGVGGKKGNLSSMSLANLMWHNKFNWAANAESLEKQVLMPIQNPNEMNQTLEQTVAKLQASNNYPPLFKIVFGTSTIQADLIAKALTQFLKTLISGNSKYDQFLRKEYQATESELRGMQLFLTHPVPEAKIRGGNCGDCHLNITLAGDPFEFRGFHNNGLDDDTNLALGLEKFTKNGFDKGKFKAPTLRNIVLTAPYMHDGRFKTLEDVLEHYDQHIKSSASLDPLIMAATNQANYDNKPVKLFLTAQEKKDIIAFLQMLTDNEFIKNPNFSDPFKK